MLRTTSVVMALGLGAMVGCTPAAETPEQAQARMATEAADARTAIEASNQAFVVHFAAGRGDSVAAGFTENGRMMEPNAPPYVGRAAIAASANAMANMKATLTLNIEEVAASGPVAIERGTYSITLSPPGAPGPVTDTGKYLVHWHKVGDQWLKVDDIWNSDLPPVSAGPPARP